MLNAERAARYRNVGIQKWRHGARAGLGAIHATSEARARGGIERVRRARTTQDLRAKVCWASHETGGVSLGTRRSRPFTGSRTCNSRPAGRVSDGVALLAANHGCPQRRCERANPHQMRKHLVRIGGG